MRKVIIAGNWKMNKTPQEALDFVNELNEKQLDEQVAVILCAPYLALSEMKKAAQHSIKIFSENVHQEASGAYTGEISIDMLKSIDITGSIIGHSERRKYFNESDEIVNQKVQAAVKNDLFAIICVGETLEQREANQHKEIVSEQVQAALNGICSDDLKKVCIAYEPVWAIGTGKSASDDDAQEMCAFIRQQINKSYDHEQAEAMRILYGGSVKPSNVKGLMAQDDIDGALVGGASLEVDSFTELVNYNK